jgi:hypothetical protein
MTAGEQVQDSREEGRDGGRSRPRRRSKADPNQAPFSDFLERDALRESRERGRRRTLMISLAVHVLVFASLLIYSVLQVDELTGPSVEVKLYRPGKLPAGVTP